MTRKPMPFQVRLMLVIMITVLLPSVFVNWLSFSVLKKQMLTDATSWLTGLTENSGEAMETYIQLVNGISKNPEYDVTLMNIFENHRLNTEGMYGYSYEDISQINGWLSMLVGMNKSIASVNFIDENGNRFHLGKEVTEPNNDWMKITDNLKGASAIFPPIKTQEGLTLFSVSRKIINPSTFNNIATMQIYFQLDFLAQEKNQVILQHGDFMILDQNQTIIYNQNGNLNGNPMPKDNREQVKAAFASDLTGWTLVAVVPKNVLFNKIDQIQKWLYTINFIFILITMLVIFWFSFQLTNPLRKLSRLMVKASKRNFDIEAIPIKRQDEIGFITESFNQMITRIHLLIYEVKEKEQKSKRSDIAALQSQINPHFLYNTLNTIAMQAEMDGNYKVMDMASQLGRLLRYSIGGMQEWVEISQECDHLWTYFRVMQYRYPSIEFELALDERVKNTLVIRLILQPLVENAIIHGISAKGTGGIVKVRIQETNKAPGRDGLLIEVEDSGVGMNKDQVETLNKYLKETQSGEKPKHGIGLKNVYDRILLTYEDNFRFDVLSEEGHGTTIRIWLLRRNKNENHGG
jgi:two-component system sensor histidine kinase YesM